ncbi:hypothetical protein FQN54_007507 [Arachnomyces sp. PD_36]|nr:hypothetical protein FQN54_007507 [Arachnomyces sp. PD_36]
MLGLGNGYAVGLYTAWLIIWAAVLLVFNDPERDFRRIESYVVPCPSHESKGIDSIQNGSATTSGSFKGMSSNLRFRTLPDNSNCSPLDSSRNDSQTSTRSGKMRIFRWQAYPESIGHRIGWVLDLTSNFRGSGWSWRIRGLPALPDFIPEQTGDICTEPIGDNKARNNETISHLRSISIQFIMSYLALDILKVTMMLDPYFRGEISSPSGPILAASPLLIRAYRISLSGLGMLSALFFAPSLMFLLFLGISTLVPQIKTWISVPLDAAWMYPQWFGNFPQDYIYHGLTGFWVRGWHQFFRFGFSEWCNFVIAHLPTRFQGKRTRRAIQLFIAFGISGTLHACGSYTTIGDTKPLAQFTFFLSQAAGILLQKALVRVIHSRLPFKVPIWLRRTGNFFFLFFWFLLVSGLFVDDLSRGGIWLLEPVPVSLVRAFGFVGPGERWWCWGAKWFRWSSGERWWDSGIQIL